MRHCIVVVCLLSLYLLFSYTNKLNRNHINIVHRRVTEPLTETQNIVDNHEDADKKKRYSVENTVRVTEPLTETQNIVDNHEDADKKKRYSVVLISTDRTKSFGIKKRIRQSVNYFLETYNEVKKQFPEVNVHVDHNTKLYKGIKVKIWRPNVKSYENVRRYAALLYANTLESYSTDVLIFEDDLFISNDIRQKINWAVEFLYSTGVTNFMIDCHNVNGRIIKRIHKNLFKVTFGYATQCMYYSSTAIPKIVKSIRTNMLPYDLTIQSLNLPCYAFDRSMIYHRGEKSTGLAGLPISHVRNPTFKKNPT